MQQSLSAIAFAPPAETPEESLQQQQAQDQAPPVKCPRCESSNTKFCYYNNYNLSQPRHFCKNCRRYWTKGGALRNIPVGGGTRKNSSSKRPNPNSPNSSPTKRTTSATSSDHHPLPLPKAEPPPLDFHSNPAEVALMDHDKMMMMSLDFTGSFSSLLLLHPSNGSAAAGHHHHFFDNNNNIILGDHASSSSSTSTSPPLPPAGGLGDLGDLNRSTDDNLLTWPVNGWPDLAIYTPGSTFQ